MGRTYIVLLAASCVLLAGYVSTEKGVIDGPVNETAGAPASGDVPGQGNGTAAEEKPPFYQVSGSVSKISPAQDLIVVFTADQGYLTFYRVPSSVIVNSVSRTMDFSEIDTADSVTVQYNFDEKGRRFITGLRDGTDKSFQLYTGEE